MGRFDGQPEIPVLRLELEGIKYSVLAMLEVKHGELQMALERGIDLAYQQIPVIVAERVRQGITEAATQATDDAMKEYFGPGGAGYKKIIQQITSYVEGQEVGPRVEPVFYAIVGERTASHSDKCPQCLRFESLEQALLQPGSQDTFIWKAEEGKPWMKMYYWNLGVWSVVPRDQR
jgi:hypothetical protein